MASSGVRVDISRFLSLSITGESEPKYSSFFAILSFIAPTSVPDEVFPDSMAERISLALPITS